MVGDTQEKNAHQTAIVIAVIDDHPIFRDGVQGALTRFGGFRVAATGNTAEDAVTIAETLNPDVILLDIMMPGGGIEAARRIEEGSSSTKVVMLTSSDSQEHRTAAIAAGAKAYLLKGIGIDELVDYIKAIHRGERVGSPNDGEGPDDISDPRRTAAIRSKRLLISNPY
jgi:two-component system, NarL family, nitrate/nitrite response regulator NarL